VVRSPPPGPIAYTALVRDITERKRSADIIRETERTLEDGQAIAHVGSWVSGVMDPDALWWSAETHRIFGVAEGEPVTVSRFFSLVHPEDREAVRAASAAALWSGAPYDVLHRIVCPDGSVRTVRERAIVVKDEHGTPVRMVGTTQDVTEQTRAEARDRFLAQVGAQLTTVLAYPAIVDTVAHLAVPALAEGAVVEVTDESGVRSAVAHRSGERTRELAALVASSRARWRPDAASAAPDRQGGAGLDRTPERGPVAGGSAIRVPLRARGNELGHVTLLADGARRFDDLDRRTAEEFAFRAGVSLLNAGL
jgi:PAS domain S-box-containing protein